MDSNRSRKKESCQANQSPATRVRRAWPGALGWLPAVAAASVLLAGGPLWGAPTTAKQAQAVAQGWLQLDARPLQTPLGGSIAGVDTFADGQGQPAWYIVSLAPTGFLIVSADDEVEPIVGFVAAGRYDPSPANPLGALVSRDLPGRLAAIRGIQASQGAVPQADSAARAKWKQLAGVSIQARPGPIMGAATVSDIRVDPLIQSQWDQTTADNTPGGPLCYNYYTPSNYPCGCVATAMAQLMRFWQFPTAGIGVVSFQITVSGAAQTASTRGGDGLGGPYVWGQMPLVTSATSTVAQCQAIGALCYDAGLSVNMNYTATSAGAANIGEAALTSTFGYANAIRGYNNGANLTSAGLQGMINPNLDAGNPVLLGINGASGAHAVLADGYGYNTSTLYHHLNMGWSGSQNLWYNLPTIDATPPGPFTTIFECGYNIYTAGTGEIISGRVTDLANKPISGATVTAVQGGNTYTATTNAKGIYALVHLPSSTTYAVSVTPTSYVFSPRNVTTGLSQNMGNTAGNRGATDFAATGLVASSIQFSAGTYSVNRDAGIATIGVTRTGGTATIASVNYTTANGTAEAGVDYTTASGTVIFAAGETAKTITVLPINTVYRLGDKTVNLSLSNPTGGASLGTPNTAVLTIVDNQAPPTLSIADVAGSETDGATTLNFQVNLTMAMSQAVTVHYQSADGTAKAGTDYTAVNGTLSIPAGQTLGVISVPVTGNSLYEADKTLQIILSSPSGATSTRSQGQGTIQNDDPQPSLSIEDATSTTSTLVLTVRATRGAKSPMTVHYQTEDDTAAAGTDYTATGGTATILSGQTTTTISVPVVTSGVYEPDKAFLVNITNATVATIARGQARGTIRSAAAVPTLSIEDATGSGAAVVFTVRLSAACKPPVSVRYQTADGTAVAGTDYTGVTGTLVVPAGQTVATISVAMAIKTTYEADKTFRINLSAPRVVTIARAQAQGTVHFVPPSLGFDDVSDLGSFVSFGLRLSTPSALPVTLQYETADGTATAGTHYSAASGTLTIPPGQTISTIIVPILGRAKDDRTVLLEVTGVTNASTPTSQVTGVIRAGANTGPGNTPTGPISNVAGCGAGVGAANMMAFYALCWAGLAAVRRGRRSM